MNTFLMYCESCRERRLEKANLFSFDFNGLNGTSSSNLFNVSGVLGSPFIQFRGHFLG